MSTMSRYLKVVKNPFHPVVGQPRIPDGKSNISVGVRVQQVRDVECPGNQIMHILFYPGINCCVTYATGSVAENGQIPAPGAPNNIYDEKHVDFAPGSANAFNQNVSANRINRWRTVSAGLLCSLTNNIDKSEGSFEACRINTGLKTTANGTQTVDGKQYFGVPLDAGSQNYPGINLSTTSMITQPSYLSRPLWELPKYLFRLNCHDSDRDFNETPINNCPVSSCYDKSHDAIYIRIMPTSAIRLKLHYMHHQEIVYDEEALLSKQQMMCFRNTRTIAVGNKMARSYVKAGVMAYGNRIMYRGISRAGRTRMRRKRRRYYS